MFRTKTMKTLTLTSILMLFGGVAAAQGYPPAPPDDPSAQQPVDPYNDGSADDTWSDVGDDNSATTYDEGTDPEAYQQFADTLAPYGNWYQDPTYGNVWTPSTAVVGVGFTPYASGGHWVLSEYGWTWVSDWDWGWAPFHYGRWLVGARGWCWVPGRHWGPGWVAWRSGGGYVGWAPLPPARWAHDHRSYAWRFTAANQLGSGRMSYVPSHSVRQVIGRTNWVRNDRSFASNGWHYNAGPGWQRGTVTPVRLNQYAPHAMPRFNSGPRPGGGHGVAPPQRYTPPQNRTIIVPSRQPQRQPHNAPRYSPPMRYSPPRSYVAPQQRSFSAPPQRSFSAPQQRSFSAPQQRSFSAPQQRSFSAPRGGFSGHASGHSHFGHR
jgi:hypothetical protein